jgi:hypothetical protein
MRESRWRMDVPLAYNSCLGWPPRWGVPDMADADPRFSSQLEMKNPSRRSAFRAQPKDGSWPTVALAYARIFFALPNFILPTSVTTAQ